MAARKATPKKQPARAVPSNPARKPGVAKTGQRPYKPLRPYK